MSVDSTAMPVRFFVVSDGDTLLWVLAQECRDEHRIFAYLPNSGSWHASTALEDAFYDPDLTHRFRLVDAATAAAALPHAPLLRGGPDGWLLMELRDGPTRTSTDFGL